MCSPLIGCYRRLLTSDWLSQKVAPLWSAVTEGCSPSISCHRGLLTFDWLSQKVAYLWLAFTEGFSPLIGCHRRLLTSDWLSQKVANLWLAVTEGCLPLIGCHIILLTFDWHPTPCLSPRSRSPHVFHPDDARDPEQRTHLFALQPCFHFSRVIVFQKISILNKYQLLFNHFIWF